MMRMQNEQATNNTTLTMLKDEKAGVEKSLQNVMYAIENRIISKTTNARLHELESRLEELERQIRIEESKIVVRVSERDVRNFYAQALLQDPQMLVSCLVKEVVLYDDRMEIHFNSPLASGDGHGSSLGTADLNASDTDNSGLKIEMYVD